MRVTPFFYIQNLMELKKQRKKVFFSNFSKIYAKFKNKTIEFFAKLNFLSLIVKLSVKNFIYENEKLLKKFFHKKNPRKIFSFFHDQISLFHEILHEQQTKHALNLLILHYYLRLKAQEKKSKFSRKHISK